MVRSAAKLTAQTLIRLQRSYPEFRPPRCYTLDMQRQVTDEACLLGISYSLIGSATMQAALPAAAHTGTRPQQDTQQTCNISLNRNCGVGEPVFSASRYQRAYIIVDRDLRTLFRRRAFSYSSQGSRARQTSHRQYLYRKPGSLMGPFHAPQIIAAENATIQYH